MLIVLDLTFITFPLHVDNMMLIPDMIVKVFSKSK